VAGVRGTNGHVTEGGILSRGKPVFSCFHSSPTAS
jgi:hypothetical protein